MLFGVRDHYLGGLTEKKSEIIKIHDFVHLNESSRQVEQQLSPRSSDFNQLYLKMMHSRMRKAGVTYMDKTILCVVINYSTPEAKTVLTITKEIKYTIDWQLQITSKAHYI